MNECDEEERFLRAPAGVFGATHCQARLVVFEVNASMLVHDQNPEFPYKDPYISRIKVAFDGMLARVARGN